MNANELAVELDAASSEMEYNHHVSDWKLLSDSATMLRQQNEQIENLKQWQRRQLDVIESLEKQIEEFKAYQKHDIELADAVGWEKGYEAGRQLGMKQERALWELAASTQEIMNGK